VYKRQEEGCTVLRRSVKELIDKSILGRPDLKIVQQRPAQE